MNILSLIKEVLAQFRERKGQFTKEEWAAVDTLIRELVPPLPRIPNQLWRTIMSRNVPTSIELVLIRDGKVLLTRRDDEFFQGAHIPGTYLKPGETYLEAAQRCAKKELGIDVHSVEPIGHAVNHPANNRFHDCSQLILCSFMGEPGAGEWFAEKPDDLLAAQQEYWDIIKPHLEH